MPVKRCRLTWKLIAIWFLSMCTILSVFIISDISSGANKCFICEKELARLSSNTPTSPGIKSAENPIINPALDLPTLYVITPTYSRPTQKADLTRLSHTLMHVKQLHWILVEDANTTSSLVGRLLLRSGVSFTHLSTETPDKFKIKDGRPRWSKPRGVWQRNSGLSWLRKLNRNQVPMGGRGGVVYFADDDNTYDLQLFEAMRWTKRVSVWPVGLVGGLKWEGPVIKGGQIVGWQTLWKPERPFAIDMAGFAINLQAILDAPAAKFIESRERGYIETSLLEQIVTPSQLEPKGEGRVLVWHTRTEKPKLHTKEDIQKMNINFKDFQSSVEV